MHLLELIGWYVRSSANEVFKRDLRHTTDRNSFSRTGIRSLIVNDEGQISMRSKSISYTDQTGNPGKSMIVEYTGILLGRITRNLRLMMIQVGQLTHYTQVETQEYNDRDGGKIVEKANAQCNYWDIILKTICRD